MSVSIFDVAVNKWQHPQRGLVAPDEFIGLAEETGLIVPIGTQVLREACREAERWRSAGPGRPPLSIKVNLSARQFAHPSLVEVVAGILSETGVDPASLYLEITESMLMEDAESTGALSSPGCRSWAATSARATISATRCRPTR